MFAEKAWLIPLLPALSFFVILFFGKKMPKGGAESGIAAVGASFLVAVFIAAEWIKDEKIVDQHLVWWRNGKTAITIGQHVDGLTVMMFVVVTFVSLMVHIYSTGYMHGDVRFTYFFAALSLFTAAMLFMVMADNLLQLMIGWELVGLCSFMLIGHWFEEKNNSSAALKAFFTTKFGDVGLMLGGITLIIAAGLAFVQDDIKRVLAYSTVSQLGYMVAALSVGAWTAGVFHLFTHAFFKALLFLGSGSVIHAVHSNNMSEMGGLKKYMPTTYWTFIIATLALAGIFPLAGFWSKDEILLGAIKNHYPYIFLLGLIGAFMTAAYMGRCVHLTFHGEYRGHGHPHESPRTMTVPLVLLAIPSVFVGLINAPGVEKFAHWVRFEVPGLKEAFEVPEHKFNPGLALFSFAVAA